MDGWMDVPKVVYNNNMFIETLHMMLKLHKIY